MKPRQRHSKSDTASLKQVPAESVTSPGDSGHLPTRRLSNESHVWSPGLTHFDSPYSPGWGAFDATTPIDSGFAGASPAASAPEHNTQDPDEDVDEEFLPQDAGYYRRTYSVDGGAIVPYSPSRSGSYPDLAMIAPCPTISPLLEFRAPAFFEFTDQANRRALLNHFCNTMSHLIVLNEGDGETQIGNPFQQLVLPLADRSPCVQNAVYALAGAHLEHRGVDNGEKALVFHQQAVQGLARMIESEGQLDRNEMLASIMLLVYYEVVSIPENSIIRVTVTDPELLPACAKGSVKHSGRAPEGRLECHA